MLPLNRGSESRKSHGMTFARSPVALALLPVVAAMGCSAKATRTQAPATPPASLMTFQDLTAVPRQPPDVRSAYGEDADQHGVLRVPAGPGPHPVVVLIHGGCFKAAYANASDLAAMGDSLKAGGIASWNVEYRRLGQAGGGWPG